MKKFLNEWFVHSGAILAIVLIALLVTLFIWGMTIVMGFLPENIETPVKVMFVGTIVIGVIGLMMATE